MGRVASIGVQTRSKIRAIRPSLRLKGHEMMTTQRSATVTDIQDAAAARWLAKLLAPARARVQAEPDADAIARIRDRVLGESAPGKARPSIAA